MKTKLYTLILIILISCSKNNPEINSLGENQLSYNKEIENKFYTSDLNVIEPETTKVSFSVIPVISEEMKYINRKIILKKFIKDNYEFEFIKAIATYHIENKGKISDDNIFAFSIYSYHKSNQLVHTFFLKENGKFEKKLELKEKTVDTENQNFLVRKFRKDLYFDDGVKISRLFNVDEPKYASKMQETRSEFTLFRVRNKYEFYEKNIETNNKSKNNYAYKSSSLGNCRVGCSETGTGTCDGGLYCNYGSGGCELTSVNDNLQFNSLKSKILKDSGLYDLDEVREFRDDYMTDSYLGNKHKDYYYAISDYLVPSDYKASTYISLASNISTVNSTVNKLNDENFPVDQPIIDLEVKTDALELVDEYKDLSNNDDYIYVMNDLEQDVDSLYNKTKSEIRSIYE